MSVLPTKLKRKPHTDWPWPFRYIPRAWTSFDWGKPKILLGERVEFDGDAPKPINPPTGWQVSYFPDAPWWAKPFAWYIGKSGKRQADGKYRNYRVGARWDNEDNYTNCTFLPVPSSRRYTGAADEDTSTGPK